MQELTHYIGGKHVNGTSGRFADVFNPATGTYQFKIMLGDNDTLNKIGAINQQLTFKPKN